MSDMKERLCRQHVINGELRFVNPDGKDGAREIDRLEKEIKRLRAALRTIAAKIVAKNKIARAALGDE